MEGGFGLEIAFTGRDGRGGGESRRHTPFVKSLAVELPPPVAPPPPDPPPGDPGTPLGELGGPVGPGRLKDVGDGKPGKPPPAPPPKPPDGRPGKPPPKPDPVPGNCRSTLTGVRLRLMGVASVKRGRIRARTASYIILNGNGKDK